MPNSRVHLRIPRRAIEQWERVKAKLAEQIEARGQGADGPTIFCEACAMLDAATGGPGIIVEVQHPYVAPPRLAELLPPSDDPRRKAADQLDLVVQLRKIADRLERDVAEQEKPAGQ